MTLQKEKGQTTIYKTLYRKLKIEKHEPHYKLGWTHMFDSCILTPICFVGGSVLFMSIVFIYVFWCLRFLYQMMFVSFNSSTTGATCGAETASPCEAHEFTPVCSGVRVSRFSVFCIMFCRSLFVLFLIGGSLYCLSYDLIVFTRKSYRISQRGTKNMKTCKHVSAWTTQTPPREVPNYNCKT
jgi:hypothetical protein